MEATNSRRIDTLESKVHDMAIDLAVAQSDIKGIKEDINSIKDDTKWLRRAITNAFIGSIIAGLVGIVFMAFQLSGG